jgi:hypothetical protein
LSCWGLHRERDCPIMLKSTLIGRGSVYRPGVLAG